MPTQRLSEPLQNLLDPLGNEKICRRQGTHQFNANLSLHDHAVVAKDVYGDSSIAMRSGWLLINKQFEQKGNKSGFQGGLYYKKGKGFIIGFRGTEGKVNDIIGADARMIPSDIPFVKLMPALNDLTALYYAKRKSQYTLSFLLTTLLGYIQTNPATRTFTGSIPKAQVSDAESFVYSCISLTENDLIAKGVDKSDIQLLFTKLHLTGHSLGGALVKSMINRIPSGIRGVAFNSPSMGNLKGMAPLCTNQIASINVEGDPLSFITAHVGMIPHTGEVLLKPGNKAFIEDLDAKVQSLKARYERECELAGIFKGNPRFESHFERRCTVARQEHDDLSKSLEKVNKVPKDNQRKVRQMLTDKSLLPSYFSLLGFHHSMNTVEELVRNKQDVEKQYRGLVS